MRRTFTHLKGIVYITLGVILFCGNLVVAKPNSAREYGVSRLSLHEASQSLQNPLSLSSLMPLAKAMSALAFNYTEVTGKTYYWVPFGLNNRGSGAWSELGHWATTSGGKERHTALPTAADDVVFDDNSFLFAGQKVTVDVDANVKDISWVNVRSTTFEGSTSSLNVYGSILVHSNLLFSSPTGFNLNFKSGTQDAQVNLLGKSLPANSKINFEGTGSWILQNQLSAGQGGSITLTEGILKSNNQNILTNTFRSIGEKTRTLELGTSTISNVSTWDVSPSLTLNALDSRIILNGLGAHTFNGGDKAYRVVVLHGPQSFVNNSNTFKELSLPTSTDATGTNTLVLESGQVQTIETLSTPGSAPYTAIQSSVKGSNATINFTSLGFCTDYLVVEDVHAQGPGNYYAGLNSDNKGNNNGWHFITCATSIYSPEGAADYDLPFSSVPAISDGSNKWQEIRFNGELVGAIKDGGNVLGEVTIDFLVSADSNRAAINTSGAEVGLMPRNWRVKATNQPSADKPVSIRLYGLQEEFEKYKNGIGTVAGLGDLQFTTYSNSDSTENCDFLDNTAEGAVTSLISNALFTTAGNYFTAELTGITDLTEFYLHNGGAAIDFIASKPAPTVQPQPEIVEEEMDFTAHWNAKTVKLKWKTTNDSQNTSYDVEAAPSADEKEFKTIISKAPRQNSSNAAVAVYHAEDFNPAPVPANYYRLKRLNQDGTVTYSQTIKVENKSFAAAVQAAPNPFTDKLKLTINAEKAGELSVKLMNEKGETALEKKVKVSKGTSTTDLVIGAKVKPGIYLLVTELNGERASQRLIKE